jgi:hypothetical protein
MVRGAFPVLDFGQSSGQQDAVDEEIQHLGQSSGQQDAVDEEIQHLSRKLYELCLGSRV